MDSLLFRPSPYKDESFGGYFLRLSHCNEFSNINWLYDLVDFTNYYNKNMAYLDLENIGTIKLLQKTGLSLNNFKSLTFHSDLELIKPTIKPNQYIKLLRQGIHSAYSKICPQCFNDQPYHKKVWEIGINFTCPIHSCFLIGFCPRCKKGISTYRNSFLSCSCGLNFADFPVRNASKEETMLSKLLEFKVQNPNVFNDESELEGGPLYNIKNVMYVILLFINLVQDLYSFKYVKAPNFRDFKEVSVLLDVIKYCQSIFVNWPENFVSFLKETKGADLRYMPIHIVNFKMYNYYIADIDIKYLNHNSIDEIFWKGFLPKVLDVTRYFQNKHLLKYHYLL